MNGRRIAEEIHDLGKWECGCREMKRQNEQKTQTGQDK